MYNAIDIIDNFCSGNLQMDASSYPQYSSLICQSSSEEIKQRLDEGEEINEISNKVIKLINILKDSY